MDETKLCSIAQLSEFLAATPEVSFNGIDALTGVLGERPEHLGERLGLNRVLKEFRFLERQADDAVRRSRS